MNGPHESEDLEQPSLPVVQPQRTKEVPEKIRKWKEEQEKMLHEKGKRGFYDEEMVKGM